ncbi:hypothetical protein [Rhizobium mongolense]|uniref:Uncharacterized protein n=1 Tax=Rhizobium mongolense TaxID=57676 RepID=A0A7W6RKH0_9HYPH|nr:hypothetical protein [Rhizobium mongolense]MBB4274120.1 hypothetical protein [Rhizobium mongolense]
MSDPAILSNHIVVISEAAVITDAIGEAFRQFPCGQPRCHAPGSGIRLAPGGDQALNGNLLLGIQIELHIEHVRTCADAHPLYVPSGFCRTLQRDLLLEGRIPA